MKPFQLTCLTLAVGALALPLQAGLIVNGGFESNLTSWNSLNQLGSAGLFQVYSGTTSPVNLLPVSAPPQGTKAALSDPDGPGSRVLYQDFVVSGGLTGYSLTFSVFVANYADDFFTPATLDFSTTALNQRARIDIIKTSANAFSLASGDILQSIFETKPGDALTSGYTSFDVDVTALMQANQGQTLRLRLAVVDNVDIFNVGFDNIDITTKSIPNGGGNVPDGLPASAAFLTLGAVVALGQWRRRSDGSKFAAR